MVQISRVQVVVQIVVQTLLVACAQLTTAAAAPPISCIHSRKQLASVSAAVASLEAQLDEARRRMIAKELEVRQCELNLTTTSQRSGEPRPAQRGRRCKLDAFALSPLWPECSLLTARKKRSLRLDGDKAGCNYCLTFQRVSDYALPRSGTSNRPRLAWICATGGALHHRGMHGLFCSVRHKLHSTVATFVLIMMQTPLPAIYLAATNLSKKAGGSCTIWCHAQVFFFACRCPAKGQHDGFFQVPPLRSKGREWNQLHWNPVW